MGAVDRGGATGNCACNYKQKRGKEVESWAIFKHAVRMVFGNLGDALKVTGVLYVVANFLQLVLIGSLLRDDTAMQVAIVSGTIPWGALALYGWLWAHFIFGP